MIKGLIKVILSILGTIGFIIIGAVAMILITFSIVYGAFEEEEPVKYH